MLTETLRRAQAIQDSSDARRGSGDDTRALEVAILLFEAAEPNAATGPGAETAPPPRRSPPLP
jgi:hypothetical protein